MPAIPWTRLADPDPDRDYVVMASRLPLRRYRNITAFLGATRAIRKQLAATEGVVGYTLDAKPLRKTFWTLSRVEERRGARTLQSRRPASVPNRGHPPAHAPNDVCSVEPAG
jgi:hypothetical protein